MRPLRPILLLALTFAALPACDGEQAPPPCTPSCDGRACGPDPRCDRSCGSCADDLVCDETAGQCVAPCEPLTCDALGASCGVRDDGCGTPLDCGACAAGRACDTTNACVDVAWPVRDCTFTLRYAAPPGTASAFLAADFNSWSDSATPLAGPDDDGVFSRTFAPGDGLVPGGRYAYKVVADGAWLLDPASTWRKYDGPCLNSAFALPACDAGPEITVREVAVDGTAGTATVRFAVATATDGAAPAALTVTLDGAPVPPAAVTTAATGGELTVVLRDLAGGKHRLALRVVDTADREAAPVDLPLWVEPAPFAWRDMTLYMFVIDRFANGHTDNDTPVGAPVERPADWHGGDLWGAADVVESGYFDDLGVNAIWLSPIARQVDGHFLGRDGPQRYTAYHGYWPIRGREVDPRYGGNAGLRAFVEAAHRHGIRVLLDLINNQVHEQHSYVASHPDWFRGECVCGIDEGCGWSERPLDCLFASYLPDINWRVPAAEDQFIADAVYWVDAFDIDGFRIDAVKHVETNSITNLRARLAQRFEQGGERLYLVGETAVDPGANADYGCDEVYPDGYTWVDAYVGPNALDGQFDFPSHHRMQEPLLADTLGYDALEGIVADAAARYRADALHVSFLGTHDSSRMASLAAHDPARACTWSAPEGDCAVLPGASTDPATYGRLARALTLLFTLPGRPLLYYGDEVGLPGGRDPDNRRDMPWEGGLASLALDGTTLSEAQRLLRSRVEALGIARRDSPALRRGARFVLVAEPTFYVYGYALEAPRDVALVAVNRGDADVVARAVGALPAGAGTGLSGFSAVAGGGSAGLDAGAVVVSVPAGEAVVLRGTPAER